MKNYEKPKLEIIMVNKNIDTAVTVSLPNANIGFPNDWKDLLG